MYKPAGTVTGLYREDYNYNPTAACFNPYKDVYRQTGAGIATSEDNDDSYTIRIVGRKKDKN